MIKKFFLEYFHHLGMYDYLAFIFELLIIVLILIFIVVLFKKQKAILGLLLILVFIMFTITTPFLPQLFFAQNLKKVEIQELKTSYLSFSKILLYSFKLQAKSTFKFSSCLVSTFITPKDVGTKEQLQKMRKNVQIVKFDGEKVKVKFDDFVFKEYNIYNYTNCF